MQRLIVIKAGGGVCENPEMLGALISQVAQIEGPAILVHGGGKQASQLCEQLDIPVEIIEGRRITSAAALEAAVMVYAGLINKRIVAALQAAGCNALGVCGADGDIIRAKKRTPRPIDYGFVGDIVKINAAQLMRWLDSGLRPVLPAITHDGAGELLNTNADTIAAQLAIALSKFFDTELILCFEHSGVLLDISEPDSLIASIAKQEYAELKRRKIISAGMVPKLDNAFAARAAGVRKVMLTSAFSLGAAIAGSKGSGTEIKE